MDGGFEKQGDERGGLETGVGIIAFTLDGCSACWELKQKLKEEGITFQNVSVDDNPKLGDALEHEYSTEYYPIVQIINNRTKTPFYTFVSESQLKGFKIINWDTIPELIKKLKNKLYEI